MSELVGNIVYGADKKVAQFVQQRLHLDRPYMPGLFTALGVVRHDVFLGGVVFHNFHPYPSGGICELSAAFDSPLFADHETLFRLCSYPFDQLRCVRVWSMVAKSNTRSRKMTEHIGMKREGAHPLGWEGRETAISYGATRKDFEERWLNGQGQRTSTADAA